jgi:hypothetical protein
MAILGTELNSSLSKGGTNVNTLDAQRSSTLHNLESLTGQGLAADKIPSQLDLDGVRPNQYIQNLPR